MAFCERIDLVRPKLALTNSGATLMRLHRAVERMKKFSRSFKLEIEVIREGVLAVGQIKHGTTKLANNELLSSC